MHNANKLLGQHFLIDQNIIKKIINSVNIEHKTVVEIGGGLGSLTKEIMVKGPKTLYVIEKDIECVNYLKELVKKYQIFIAQSYNYQVINQDCLEYNYNNIDLIIGNLPYNIASKIIQKLYLESNFTEGLFMIQKEQADRIVAIHRNKIYGTLSVMCQLDWEVKKIFNISKHCFRPRPKVESSMIYIKNHNQINKIDKKKILEIVYKLFLNRRKKVKINSLHHLCADQISPEMYKNFYFKNVSLMNLNY